jgi:hypothetical protein
MWGGEGEEPGAREPAGKQITTMRISMIVDQTYGEAEGGSSNDQSNDHGY